MNRLLVLVGLLLITSTLARAADRPNIVLIISDDQAWTDYSFMGHPQIHTPHLDRLAAQGRMFRHGYVPSSLCSPSLASLITGLYAHQHGITSNDPPAPVVKAGQDPAADPTYLAQRQEMVGNFERVPTLPRLLAGQGYVSFQAGKWWGGHYRTGGFTDGMTHGDPERGGRHGDEGLKIGRETMQPVLDFIDASAGAGKPFFLWYAPMLPHQPHDPPERLLAKYRDKTPSLHVAKYWAMCERFDETCGELLDHLDRRGLAENTLVVFLADNGWIQDPQAVQYAARSKQSPYDGGLRTPILVRWPGKVEPGISDRPVSSLDLAPTILSAAGLKPAPEMAGVDLRDEAAIARREALFGEIFTHNAVDVRRPVSSLRFRWVVAGDWKLILPARGNEPDAPVELFNLAEDPLESRDWSGDNPRKVAELRSLIDAWWAARD